VNDRPNGGRLASAKEDGSSISVVIAVRNCVDTLQGCLDSVYEQTHRPLELIVIDGASTDGTLELVARNGPALAYWESRADRGIYHAWNKALRHATHEWICFLGADDRLHAPDVLAHVAPSLEAAVGFCRVVYGGIDIIDPSGTRRATFGEDWETARASFRAGQMLPHAATFHHRSLFAERGAFDERFRIAGDYELLLRELLEHEAIGLPDLVVVDVAEGGVSDRPETDGTRIREKHRARRMHGLTDEPEWRSPEVLKAVIRAWIARNLGRRALTRLRDVSRRLRRRTDDPATS
jgi:glycosyltransferase involved in cell wall biosynthesis